MSYTDDYYAEQARKLGLRARSFFKLQEIDDKFRLIKKGKRVLDLGAAPGSWSQYCLKKTSGNIELFSIDLTPIEPFTEGKATLFQGSVFELGKFELPKSFHLVLSDMAPSTTGSRQTDSAQSFELAREAGKIASRALEPGGFVVAKYLQGSEFQELQRFFKEHFSDLKLFKPKSSRKNSTEIFFVAAR